MRKKEDVVKQAFVQPTFELQRAGCFSVMTDANTQVVCRQLRMAARTRKIQVVLRVIEMVAVTVF
jgi:hypothetical protein